jgi:hypothetical protein
MLAASVTTRSCSMRPQHVAQQRLAASRVERPRTRGGVEREPIERRAERLVELERVPLERR